MTTYTYPDILDIHLQTLLQQGEAKTGLIENAPGTPAILTALFSLVHDLWRLLRPVAPSPVFRASLGQQLETEARRQQTQRALGLPPRQPARSRWLAPATAIGTVSLVGVGAYAYWRRSRQTAATDQPLAA